jgi:hypothetical protein
MPNYQHTTQNTSLVYLCFAACDVNCVSGCIQKGAGKCDSACIAGYSVSNQVCVGKYEQKYTKFLLLYMYSASPVYFSHTWVYMAPTTELMKGMQVIDFIRTNGIIYTHFVNVTERKFLPNSFHGSICL